MSCTYPSDRSDVDQGHGIVVSHQRVKRLEASETVCVIAPTRSWSASTCLKYDPVEKHRES